MSDKKSKKLPAPQKKHPEDILPKVVMCGKNEFNLPTILICEPREKTKRPCWQKEEVYKEDETETDAPPEVLKSDAAAQDEENVEVKEDVPAAGEEEQTEEEEQAEEETVASEKTEEEAAPPEEEAAPPDEEALLEEDAPPEEEN